MLILTVIKYSDYYTKLGVVTHSPVSTIEELHEQAHEYRNTFMHTLRVVENGISRRYRKDEVSA